MWHAQQKRTRAVPASYFYNARDYDLYICTWYLTTAARGELTAPTQRVLSIRYSQETNPKIPVCRLQFAGMLVLTAEKARAKLLAPGVRHAAVPLRPPEHPRLIPVAPCSSSRSPTSTSGLLRRESSALTENARPRLPPRCRFFLLCLHDIIRSTSRAWTAAQIAGKGEKRV